MNMTQDEFRQICYGVEFDNHDAFVGTPIDRDDQYIHLRGDFRLQDLERLVCAWQQYRVSSEATTDSLPGEEREGG